MRKFAIAAGVLLVVVVAVIAALPFVVDVNRYRPQIQAELQAKTGRPVSLGRMALKVFPFAFRVDNAVIGEDKQFPQQHAFAETQELYVSAQLMPLLRGEVVINSVELRRPKIELVRNPQGVWNFASLGKAGSKPSAVKPDSQPQGTEASAKPISLADLRVVDGLVAITDEQKRQPRAVYDHIDLEIQDFGSGKAMPVTLAAHLPGSGKETVSFKGSIGPVNESNYSASNFDGTLNLDQVSMAGLEKFLQSKSLSGIEFVATGDAKVSSNNGDVTSSGNLKLADGHVHGVDIGYPISLDYNVAADLNKNLISIQKGDLKLGSTPISIAGSVNAARTPSVIDIKLTAENASISEAARLASAFGVAFNPGMQINGKLNANISAKGASDSPALNGSVSASELVISGKDLPEAVHVTGVTLALTPEAVRSNEFVATTGKTAVKANFLLNHYTAKNSSVDASLQTTDAQLGELLDIARAYGISAVEGMKGTGPVSLQVRVQGPTKNPAALTYDGKGNLQNASLTVPSLIKPVQIKNANLRFSQNSAVLENAAFSLGSTNASGQLTLKGLTPNAVPEAQFALNADKFDVAEWEKIMASPPQPQRAALEPWPQTKTMNISLVPAAQAQATTAKKSSAPRVQAVPSLLDRLVGSGTVQVGTILYDEITLSNAKSNVSLDRGLIKLAPFTAQVYGGTETGSVVLDERTKPATYTVTSKLDHVDANQLLSSMSSLKKTLYGMLAANANASFSSTSSADIARSLNGNISLNLQNGKLAHVDLLNELASIGKFVQGGKSAEPFTNLVKMTGDFNVKDGVARTNNLNAIIDGGSLAATGAVNLADQALDLAVTAVLNKDYSQKVGGTGIGGYLNTALANAKGEIVMPVLVTGTFSQPRIAPDLKRLAEMKLQNLLPSSGNPGALTTGILSGILGKGGQAGSGGSALSNVLGALGGRKNPGQPQQQPAGNPSQVNGAPENPDSGAGAGQQAPPNSLSDILNGVVGAVGKKKQTQPAQQPPAQGEQPPPKAPAEPPK